MKFKDSAEHYREELRLQYGHENLIFLKEDYFDEAIIGVTLDGQVVYDEEVICLQLMSKDGMSEEEEIEYFEFNIAGAHIEMGPIFINVIDETQLENK